MVTIEFEEDETCITILDDTGQNEDVSVLLYDNYCYIRQYNEEKNRFDLIVMNPEMYLKLMQAWNLPEGTYVLDSSVHK